MPGVLPVPIVLVSYMRPHLLRRIIPLIDKKTLYPHRIIVVHNSPENDFENPVNREAVDLIKRFKVTGEISDHIFTERNLGQAGGQNVGLNWVNANMPIESRYIVFTQDDLEPPDLRPCWLERMVHLIDKHPDYGSIAMRIERTGRLDWDEKDELIPSHKSVPAVFRIHRLDELNALGTDPFAGVKRWESQLAARLMEKLHKKQGFATHVFASHWGYTEENKGYLGEFKDYFSYSPERVHQAEDKPYPKIDPNSLEPIPNQVFPHDKEEFDYRNKYWNEHIGLQSDQETRRKRIQKDEAKKIVLSKGGKWVDLGSGSDKIDPSMDGIDAWPYPGVTMTGDCMDLWFVEDATYDGVAASHLLEHSKRPIKETLKEWDRILKPGGTMVLIVPNAAKRPSTILELSHNYALTPEVLGQLVGRFLGHKIERLDNIAGVPDRKAALICVSTKRL